MGDYKSLRVWEEAHGLALEVYRATADFPGRETYGLTAQMRRAALSVPTNLAEGSGRNTRGALGRFCRISLGSANELEYQLILARDLGYLPPEQQSILGERVDHVKRMLTNLMHALTDR